MTDIKNIKHKAFLYDATRCIDCRACMMACSVENNIPMNKTRIWRISGPRSRFDGLSLYALRRPRLFVSLPGGCL